MCDTFVSLVYYFIVLYWWFCHRYNCLISDKLATFVFTKSPCHHIPLFNGGKMYESSKQKYGDIFPNQELWEDAADLKAKNYSRYIYRNLTVNF